MKKGGFAIMGIGAMIALVSAAIKGREAASIGIIGGADGPTKIIVSEINLYKNKYASNAPNGSDKPLINVFLIALYFELVA